MLKDGYKGHKIDFDLSLQLGLSNKHTTHSAHTQFAHTLRTLATHSTTMYNLYAPIEMSYGTAAMVIGRGGCNIDALKRECRHRNIWFDRKEGHLLITSTVPSSL